MQDGVMLAVVELRQPGIAEVIVGGRLVAPHGFQETDRIFRIVLIPVGRLRIGRLRGVFVDILLQGIDGAGGHLQISRQDIVEDGMVGRTLDVRLTAQGVDTAAADPHIAEEQLDDRHGPDVLAADGMMGPAEGIAFGAGLVSWRRWHRTLYTP